MIIVQFNGFLKLFLKRKHFFIFSSVDNNNKISLSFIIRGETMHVCITRAEVSNKPKKKHKLPKVMKNKKEKKKKRKSTIQPFFRGETLLLSNFSGGGGWLGENGTIQQGKLFLKRKF